MSSKLLVVNELMAIAKAATTRDAERRARRYAALRNRLMRYGQFFLIRYALRRVFSRATLLSPAWAKRLSIALAQGFSSAFTWNQSLLMILHKAARRANGLHLSAAGITLLHLAHNYLMVAKADIMNPGYIGLWASVLPSFTRKKLLACFGSAVEEYPEFLTSEAAAARLPAEIRAVFLKQLQVVSALYGIGFLLQRLGKRGGRPLGAALANTLLRAVRTSCVLTVLPFALIYYPLFKRLLTGLGDRKRSFGGLARHAAVGTMFSVPAFLIEPKKRLNTIVVYTIWRVMEGVINSAAAKDRRAAAAAERGNSSLLEKSRASSAGGGGQQQAKLLSTFMCVVGFMD